jgi:phospholipase C
MSTRNVRWIACGMFPIALWGLCACGGSSSTQTSAAPPSLTFSASASSINAGQNVSLSWQASNATSVVIMAIEGASTQTVTTSTQATGSISVSPSQTTTYQASASGNGGDSSAQSVTVNVMPTAAPPQITQFTVNPTMVNSGQSMTLTWATTNTTSITITPGVPTPDDSGQLPTSGSDSVPVSTTTTFALTATGPGGTAGPQNVTVTVPFALSLTVSPVTITAGQSATLAWQVSNGAPTSISITDAAGNALCNPCTLPTGSATITPTATTTYTATAAVNATTSIQQSATVTVSAPSSGVIKHIFFMVQENRSFDMYFGELGAYRSGRLAQFGITDTQTIDSFNPNVTLTNHKTGATVQPFHETTVCTDSVTPVWDPSHHDVSLAGGDKAWATTTTYTNSSFGMAGFLDQLGAATFTNDPNNSRAMGYYDQQDLPFYYDLATFFATSDSWHSPILSSTVPNRMYLMAATSFGHEYPDPTGHPSYGAQTIFRAMNAANVGWLYYYKNGVFLANFADFQNPAIASRVFPESDLLNRLAGTCSGSPCDPDQALPQVVFIENASDGLDEHPYYLSDIQKGAAYAESIISALMNSDAWKDSVFILSYDEGGGFYDHVPPFMVPLPDSYGPGQCPDPNNGTPYYCTKGSLGGTFNLTGFRVPVIVVSPYAKPNFVSHVPRDYTAILAFIEETFNVPALTARDAYWQDPSRDMSEFFDFKTTPPLLNAPNGESWTKVLNAQTATGVCDSTKESGP